MLINDYDFVSGDNNHNNHSDNVLVKTPRKLTDGNGIEPLENGLSSASESEIIIVNRYEWVWTGVMCIMIQSIDYVNSYSFDKYYVWNIMVE